MKNWKITYQLKDDQMLYEVIVPGVNRVMAWGVFEDLGIKDIVAIRCDLIVEEE